MKKRRKRRMSRDVEVEVSMTPMIDVVFQLLIYFLITFSTPDVLAHLDISRPSPEATKAKSETPSNMIKIAIFADGGKSSGYTINGRKVSLQNLEQMLARLAGISKEQSVLITCASQSFHGKLIHVLDICAQHGLKKLSVVSGI